MSTPTVRPNLPKSARLWWIVAAGLFLLLAGRIAITLITDSLWFDSVDSRQVFTTQLVSQVIVGVCAGALAGVVMGLNLWWAFRQRPTSKGQTPFVDRLRMVFDKWALPTSLGAGAVIAVIAGLSAAPQYVRYLAWSRSHDFGYKDPYFGLDASFFVFDYPWWRTVVSFVSTLAFCTLIAVAMVHLLSGAWRSGPHRVNRSGEQVPTMARGASGQLSLLAALLLVTMGLDYLLDRYGLAVKNSGLFTGITYTDDKARATALAILAIIAFLCAALFVANVFVRHWLTPLLAVVLMVLSSIVISMLYPFLMQQFWVKPSEPDREGPYIDRHIKATRYAYDINGVDLTEYAAKTTAEPGQLKSDAEALPGIRLIDPAVVSRTFDQLQQVRGYYTFAKALDVDRYTIDGKQVDTVVAAREIDVNGLPEKNWNNTHTVYTHGFGLVAAYGNRRAPGGDPEWLAKDIPPAGVLKQEQSRIYFGELQKEYAITGAKPGAAPIELDRPGDGGKGEQTSTYTGKGGVPIGSLATRSLYAAKFGDLNFLLSDRVHANSKLLYDRTPVERLGKVAPWLVPDADPYPTIVDGRLVWIVDAYTTSNSFPGSESRNLTEATKDRQTLRSQSFIETPQPVNYMRNAVKAVVDAYDGSVTLYAWDEADPILKTWRSVFPGLVKDKKEISASLISHLRYPEDLFKMQRDILGRYHMTNSKAWYEQSDLWVTSEDPVAAKSGETGMAGLKEPAYYLSIKWPGAEKPAFALTTSFVPRGRHNLAAYMSVVADPALPDYGKLRVLRMSDSHQIDGPGQSFNAMTTNEKVAERLRPFLNQGAARSIFGNLLTLPLGGGLMYVTPVYTQREGEATSAYPVLRFVIVRFGDHVAIGDTLQAALDEVFKGNAGASTNEGGKADGVKPQDPTQPTQPTAPVDPKAVVNESLKKAQVAFEDADKALKAGNLGEYQAKVAEARKALEAAATAANK